MESPSLRRAKVLFSQLTQLENELGSGLSLEECSSQAVLNQEMETIAKEREQAYFDVKKLSNLLYGEEVMKVWNDAALAIERDPILNDGLIRYDFSRQEERIRCTQKFFRIADILCTKNEERDKHWLSAFSRLIETFDPSLGMRLFVHYKLWIGTITNQGSPEQQKKWIYDVDAFRMKVIGCFGMTELGYSSHLRGSETIATFDESTDEIIINSNSIKATKWWIGLAGQIATHCIVFGNLISKGKPCGIQLFIVPLRDPKTGITFPGVTIGDLGAKAARNGLDNGWLQFSNVRIPRENMLCRWAQLSRNGDFTPPPNLALAYGSTITERVNGAESSIMFVDPCLTVAIRYSAIRRQGPKNPQILDYQTHQQLLIPNLATSYAIHFATKKTNEFYRNALAYLHAGDNKSYLKVLPELHGISCGMKMACGWWATEALEACRRSLGGHAYHAFSTIPDRTNSFAVVTTGGGDNYVLAQQSAAYLLKILRDVMTGKQIHGESVNYLLEMTNGSYTAPKPFQTLEEFLQLPSLLHAFRHVALRSLQEVGSKIQESVATGNKASQVFNNHLATFVDVVQAYINHFILDSFVQAVKATTDEGLHRILSQLCILYALHTMNKFVTSFVEFGIIVPSSLPLLRQNILELSKQIRTVAVALVDAFAFPDFVLMSPLGKYDGNIYNAYLEAIKNARGGRDIAAPFWDQLVKPRVCNSNQQ